MSEGRVRIVCTLGPASQSVNVLVELCRAGMDVARLNFSHGEHEDHRRTILNVREASRITGREIAVLQDLQGPKIRVGSFGSASVELVPGAAFTITTAEVEGTAARVSTTYENLPADVHEGDAILLDDGKLRLRVRRVAPPEVECEVEVGGTLSAHKGINLPGVAVSAPSFTEKDLEDLAFGMEIGVDVIALSFVRSAADIRALRAAMAARVGSGAVLPIVAKIEKPQAVANIEGIVAEADGIMVARGDMGVEMPPEEVPVLQKRIIGTCNAAGKPVIVATQMLESMIGSPVPTRAEASDVANAVVDGCDAVMLSGETSVGKYPLEAVRIMNRIILRVEAEDLRLRRRALDVPAQPVDSRLDALARAACMLAEQMSAAAIVVVTHTGQSARMIARYRPKPHIVGLTDSPAIRRRLNLVWGVNGMSVDALGHDSDREIEMIQQRMLDAGFVARGEYVVVLAGQPFFRRGSTNFIKVEKIE
jgi:pyruvate kinase